MNINFKANNLKMENVMPLICGTSLFMPLIEDKFLFYYKDIEKCFKLIADDGKVCWFRRLTFAGLED